MGHPDYASVEIPDDPVEEWHWKHRRAYVYRELIEAGHHSVLNKSQLAKELDITRKTLYSDLDAVSEYMVEELDADQEQSKAITVFNRAVGQLMAEGEYEKAAKVQSMWDEWLENRGIVDKEPETHRVEGSVWTQSASEE